MTMNSSLRAYSRERKKNHAYVLRAKEGEKVPPVHFHFICQLISSVEVF